MVVIPFSIFLETSVQTIEFTDDHLVLLPPITSDQCIYSEWLVSQEDSSSFVIFDVENSDGNTPAELTIVEGRLQRNVDSVVTISF